MRRADKQSKGIAKQGNARALTGTDTYSFGNELLRTGIVKQGFEKQRQREVLLGKCEAMKSGG